MNDWHTRVQRPQQLARALAARGYRCFYLNPNLGREFPYPVCLGNPSRLNRLEENIWEIHAGLPREPVFHHRLLRQAESDRVAADILRVLGAFQTERLVVVNQFPLWNKACLQIRKHYPTCVIYDCHDLLSGFLNIAPEILGAEAELFREADSVLFSAQSLLEKQLAEMPWLGQKAHVVRNGVDVTRFRMAIGGCDGEAKRKVVGYVGAIEDWFDVDAVEAAATAYPECDFVFLGKVENQKVLALQQRLSNVQFLGEIAYDHIPEYLEQFDVGLIPFRVQDLTLATNPIKLYEYFSCGLPVVSTALPEVEQYGELVYVAKTAEEFARQTGAALGEGSSGELRARRRDLAQRESWEARVEELLWVAGERTAGGRSQ